MALSGESILGLNDYLSMVMPNLHQMSKSNLIQVKKNKTMQWLNALPSDQQHDIVELARTSRIQVKKDYKSAEEDTPPKHIIIIMIPSICSCV